MPEKALIKYLDYNYNGGFQMSSDIFVVVLCVIVAAAGIWCWWFENHGEEK